MSEAYTHSYGNWLVTVTVGVTEDGQYVPQTRIKNELRGIDQALPGPTFFFKQADVAIDEAITNAERYIHTTYGD
jgi:hypothetical protein